MASKSYVSTMGSTQYLYATASLDYTRRDIRLVELQRNEELDNIECVLRSYPVDGPHPPYIALSYAWGDDIRYTVIKLNGCSLSIGKNLWHFLSQMRSSNKFYTYWIDAICIDQTNLRERNHQVQMMRQIYSNAESVYAWLGDEDEMTYSNTAMMYLAERNVFEAATMMTKRFWTPRQAEAMVSLCERPYWTRVWIVQELLLAKEVKILCGSKAISWYQFRKFFDDIAILIHGGWGQHVGVYPTFHSAASNIVMLKTSWSKQPSQPLLTLVGLCRDQKSSDIRDKVYALAGLADDPDELEVDYGITVKQLLVVVLKHACTAMKSSVNIRKSRSRLLRTGQMLREALRVHCDDQQLEGIIISEEEHLQFNEECVGIVASKLARDTFLEKMENSDRVAEISNLNMKEERTSLNAEFEFERYMERVYGTKMTETRLEYSIVPHWMYCCFKDLHKTAENNSAQQMTSQQGNSSAIRDPPRLIECVLCHHSSTENEVGHQRASKHGIWRCKAEWYHRSKDHNLGAWLGWRFYLKHIERHHSELETYQYLCRQGVIDDPELQRLQCHDKPWRLPLGYDTATKYLRDSEGVATDFLWPSS
jgi:hypothetical protein